MANYACAIADLVYICHLPTFSRAAVSLQHEIIIYMTCRAIFSESLSESQ